MIIYHPDPAYVVSSTLVALSSGNIDRADPLISKRSRKGHLNSRDLSWFARVRTLFTCMAAVYGDDFVYDYDDFSDFDEHSSENEEGLDEIEDEEVDDEEELYHFAYGMLNNDEMIACVWLNTELKGTILS